MFVQFEWHDINQRQREHSLLLNFFEHEEYCNGNNENYYCSDEKGTLKRGCIASGFWDYWIWFYWVHYVRYDTILNRKSLACSIGVRINYTLVHKIDFITNRYDCKNILSRLKRICIWNLRAS